MKITNLSQKHGFTLLELLVSMAVIGILTSIAIPQYQSYRSRAFDVRAVTDLRNAAIAEEAYFLDWEEYKSCQNETCTAELPGLAALSEGVVLQITAGDLSFTGSATHPRGSGKIFNWDSAAGGMLAD